MKLFKWFQRKLRGQKTYLALLGVGATEVAYVTGHLDLAARDALLKVLAGSGVAALAAKFNRIYDELKATNNQAARSGK